MFETCSPSPGLCLFSLRWEDRIWTECGTLTWLCIYLALFTDPFSMGYKTRWYCVNSQICLFSFPIFWKLSRWIKMKVTAPMITWSWRQKRIVRSPSCSQVLYTNEFIQHAHSIPSKKKKMQDLIHPFIFIILLYCKIIAILQTGCVYPLQLGHLETKF